jgi:hypothetical protein
MGESRSPVEDQRLASTVDGRQHGVPCPTTHAVLYPVDIARTIRINATRAFKRDKSSIVF